MGLFTNIIGYFNPNEPPTQLLMQQHLMNQQAMQQQMNQAYSGYFNAGGAGGGGQNMKGIGGYSQASPPMYRIDEAVNKLQRYAELCGDGVQIVDIEEDAPCEDVKIIMLKASEEGEVVKEVGIKISDTKFAVYREKGEIYV